MSVYKIPDSNVKEGLRITTKEGMTVQTYDLVFNTLVRYMDIKIDGQTAGVYLSNNSPGTKWYKIKMKNTRDLYIEDKDLPKMTVYILSDGVVDLLGRKWKNNMEVYSGGANIRKTASAKDNSNIWKQAYTGLVGKFKSITKNAEGEWICTDTGLFIFSKLALMEPAKVNPSGKQENNQEIPPENKFKIGIGMIVAALGGMIWFLSGKNEH